MSEIKREKCPFCGGTNIVMRDVSGIFGKSAYARTYHYMQCRDCLTQTGYHGTKQKTIKAWNTRKPMERIVERLEGLRAKYEKIVENPHMQGIANVAVMRMHGIEEAIKIVKGGGVDETD